MTSTNENIKDVTRNLSLVSGATSDNLLRYGFVKPYIRKNIDGPVLICSNGMAHWLSVFDRIKLFFKLTSLAKLDIKYSSKNCSLSSYYSG